MPFFDRFWQGKVVLAAANLLLGFALFLWVILIVAPSSNQTTPVTPICGGAALLLLGIGIGYMLSANRGRRRKLARLAAIAGDVDAVPTARIRVESAHAVDMSAMPLVIAWRPSHVMQIAAVIAVPFFAVGLASFIGQSGDIVHAIFSAVAADPAISIPLAAAMVLVLDIGIRSWSSVPGGVVFLFGGKVRTTATAEGIFYSAPLRRRQFVPWHGARLLEVRQTIGSRSTWGPGRHFMLYGIHGIVQWHDPTAQAGYLVPLGVTLQQQSARTHSLLDLVQTRTGLVPRTFDSALLPPPLLRRNRSSSDLSAASTTTARLRWPEDAAWSILAGAMLVASVLALLALVVAVIVAPLTTSVLVNLLVAAAIALPTLFATAVAVVGLLRRHTLLPRPSTAAPSGSAMLVMPSIQLAPDVVCVYSWSPMSLRSRLLAAAGGVLLTLLLAPAAIGISTTLGIALPGGTRLASTDDFHVIVAFILVIPGIIGPLLLIATLLPHRPNLVRATADDLESRSMRIPWDQIEAIDIIRLGDDVSYLVKPAGGSDPIVWSSKHLREDVPLPGALRVSADELAVVVSQRSGVPLTTREM